MDIDYTTTPHGPVDYPDFPDRPATKRHAWSREEVDALERIVRDSYAALAARLGLDHHGHDDAPRRYTPEPGGSTASVGAADTSWRRHPAPDLTSAALERCARCPRLAVLDGTLCPDCRKAATKLAALHLALATLCVNATRGRKPAQENH